MKTSTVGTRKGADGFFTSTIPFDRATIRRQDARKTEFVRLFWIGLRNLCRSGRFAQFGIQSVQELKQLVTLNATAPPVAIHDPLQQEEIRQIRFQNGVLSDRTWAEEVGLDYDVQKQQGAKPQAKGGAVPQTPETPSTPVMEGGEGSGRYEKGSGLGKRTQTTAPTHGNIESLVDEVRANPHKDHTGKRTDFAFVDDSAAHKLRTATGIKEISGDYVHSLSGGIVAHVFNEHGEEFRKGQLPVTKQDLAFLPNVIHNPTEVHYLGADNAGRDKIAFVKKINGHILVVEEVHPRHGTIEVHSVQKFSADSYKSGFSGIAKAPKTNLNESTISDTARTGTSKTLPIANRAFTADEGNGTSPIIERSSEKVKRSAISAALESVQTTEEARAILQQLYP